MLLSPPTGDKNLPPQLQDWFRQLRTYISGASGSIPWSNVSKAGSNLSEIVTRNHDTLQNISGGGSNHLSTSQYDNVIREFAVVTVATLPVLPVNGWRSFVSDATVTTFASTVVGGGANNVPVFYDGTNWKIG